MEPISPFWFKQRQCKLDPAGENTYKVTGSNLGEADLRVFTENGRWKAALSTTAGGPDVDVAARDFATPDEAWAAAFEMYRNRFIV
jgi:hypothetical protein